MRTTTDEAAPAGNRGLTTDDLLGVPMAEGQSIHLPVCRRKYRQCADRGPAGVSCNRPEGHTGRHLFYHRHLDGRVRAVWGG